MRDNGIKLLLEIRYARVLRRLWREILTLFVCIILQSPASPVQAQDLLNENCTISILNRTAQVQPDGSWRIDNVPANFGAVRARATCVEGGVTLSGQSGLFVVEAGIANGFDARIVLGAVDPIPAALAVTAPIATLTAAGATARLSVTATFPDGNTARRSRSRAASGRPALFWRRATT